MRPIDADALGDITVTINGTVFVRYEDIMNEPTIAIDDDLISREALVDDLSDNAGWDFTSRIGMIISRQPTIEPEPKRGRWIRTTTTESVCEEWTCNKCKGEVLATTNYCPNCGARMEKSDD